MKEYLSFVLFSICLKPLPPIYPLGCPTNVNTFLFYCCFTRRRTLPFSYHYQYNPIVFQFLHPTIFPSRQQFYYKLLFEQGLYLN